MMHHARVIRRGSIFWARSNPRIQPVADPYGAHLLQKLVTPKACCQKRDFDENGVPLEYIVFDKKKQGENDRKLELLGLSDVYNTSCQIGSANDKEEHPT